METFAAAPRGSAGEALRSLMERFYGFIGSEELSEDLTVMLLQRRW
jgi:hypothetical protein